MTQGTQPITEQVVRDLSPDQIESLLLRGGYNWAELLAAVQSEEGRIKLANVVRPMLYFAKLEKLPNEDLVPVPQEHVDEESD